MVHVSNLRSINIVIHGRRTSVRLEPDFIDSLNEIAASCGLTLNTLAERVEGLRGQTPRSSALRLHALHHYRRRRSTVTISCIASSWKSS